MVQTPLQRTWSPPTGTVWRTYCVARFTLHEVVSRRVILAGALISLAYIALFSLGFHIAHDKAFDNVQDVRTRVAVDAAIAGLTLFGLYVVNYLACFLALFLSVGAISGEIDSGTLHAVLARPIRRCELVLGRWLAYGALMSVYVGVMVTAVVLVARWLAGYEVPDPARAGGLMILEAVVLMTLSLLGSTLLPTLANGVIVFTLLGLAWLAGIIESVGIALENDTLLNIGTATSLLVPSDALWRGASYYLQPPVLLAATGAGRGALPLVSDVPPATPLLIWAVLYAALALLTAMVVFSRRDL